MFNNIFSKRAPRTVTPNSQAQVSTATDRIERAEVKTTHVFDVKTQFAPIDATNLFLMDEQYGKMVQKTFLDMLTNMIGTSTWVPYYDYYSSPGLLKIQNENAYAISAGKSPIYAGKYVGYHDRNSMSMDFWKKFVTSDWKNDFLFENFAVTISHINHMSGDKGVYELSLDANPYRFMGGLSIYIGTRTGWSLEYMRRFVKVAQLLVMTKLGNNRTPSFGAVGTFSDYWNLGAPYFDYEKMKRVCNNDDRIVSAHKFLRANSTSESWEHGTFTIIVREHAQNYLFAPRDFRSTTNCQYFGIWISNDRIDARSYRSMNYR